MMCVCRHDIWFGEMTSSGEKVAVKMMSTLCLNPSHVREGLEREYRLLFHLHHPNIVRCKYDVNDYDDGMKMRCEYGVNMM